MRRLLNLFPAILIIHDGGAAAPAGDGGAAAAAGQNNGGSQLPGVANRGKTGEAKPVVLYGKQPQGSAPDAGGQKQTNTSTQTPDETPEQRKAAYEEFKSKYKDEFTAETQQIINRRFKETKELQERADAVKPLVDALADKYGIKDGDVKKILDAFDNDNTLWNELAEEAGLSVEQFKQQRKTDRENAQLRERVNQIDAMQQANQRKAEWIRQGSEMKATYPGFDLESEIAGNPNFVNLLKSGIDVKTAYQATHFDEIVSGVVQTAGKRTEQTVINNIQSRAKRPAEAGASTQPGIIVKDDPSKLTRADRAEIARRAARGEQIRF